MAPGPLSRSQRLMRPLRALGVAAARAGEPLRLPATAPAAADLDLAAGLGALPLGETVRREVRLIIGRKHLGFRVMPELTAWPAVDVLAAFRARTLSPMEYLQALLDGIEAAPPRVNALDDDSADAAMRSAALGGASDKRPSPLHAGRIWKLPQSSRLAGRRCDLPPCPL